MYVVYLVDSGFVLPWDSPCDSNKKLISQNLTANEAAGHPLVNGNKRKKIMAFRKRRDCCGPHALEVTSLNAVASNLLSTFL